MKFWSKLGVLQKVLFIGIIITAIASFMVVPTMKTKNEKFVTLYSELSLKEAGEITKNLKELRIPYKIMDGGTKILVPELQVYESRLNLASKGIPKGGTVGYEIFDKNNLGTTAFVEEINYKRALEGELVRTIQSIEEVSSVRVHLVTPKERLFKEDQKSPSASVVLRLKSPLSESQIKGIAHLIASSVEGLEAQNVTILDYSGDLLHGGTSSDADNIAILSSTQLETKRDVERYLAQKAQALLEKAVGYSNVIVKVNADINFTNIVETNEKYDPEGQVVRSEEKRSGGANGEKSSVTNYEITKSVQQVINRAGTINRLSVSALINGTYELVEENGKKSYKYTPRSEIDLMKFQSLVKNAVGYTLTRGDSIEVTSVPFGAPVIELPKKDEGIPILVIIQPLITPIVTGIVIIVVLMFLIRLLGSMPAISRPSTSRPVANGKTAARNQTAENMATEGPQGEKTDFNKLKEDFTKTVTENPNMLAGVIKRLLK
ncbi:MAG: flagellar basal-body MS-ring/collar protein FliF [bacterium]|nr:flagellar basal-body MS-ring/collar protein FliF [bacterium]